MKTFGKRFLCVAACVLLFAPLQAQNRPDPLNDKEVNALRETATDPPQRLKLLIRFTRERLDVIERLHKDPKAASQDDRMGELLDQFAGLADEIDDNLSAYNSRSADLRKPLRAVIEADEDFQRRLQAIKATSTAAQLQTYGLYLEGAIDSVNSSTDSARDMLTAQLATKGQDKYKPEKESKKDKKNNDDFGLGKQRSDSADVGGIGPVPQ